MPEGGPSQHPLQCETSSSIHGPPLQGPGDSIVQIGVPALTPEQALVSHLKGQYLNNPKGSKVTVWPN